MSEIKRRIFEYLKIKGISKTSFYEVSGIAASNFKGAGATSELGGDKIAKILTLYEDLNADWLLTGRGNIFATKTPEKVRDSNPNKIPNQKPNFPKLQKRLGNNEYPKEEESFEKNIADVVVDKVFKLRTDRLIDRQQIPIYDMEAVAGLVPLFADQYSQSIVEVMETTLIPKCDGGLRIVGDSMYPLLKSGDIVFYKQIHDILNNIVWGEMYLVSFDVDGDEYVSVKYLQKSDIPDHVVLVSYNEHHKPMEIHVNRIRALAFIKASLRLNSLK
ncbi:helix-turn-helix transcriptional regulator [Alistipes senegalensis]|uniref:S24 family peptidase n=1 Tax=Alistipes senegalensis TaxID=1288121 RepID=UPI0018A90D22|nr:S24 family peptidase [Alistipes senegalensis]